MDECLTEELMEVQTLHACNKCVFDNLEIKFAYIRQFGEEPSCEKCNIENK